MSTTSGHKDRQSRQGEESEDSNENKNSAGGNQSDSGNINCHYRVFVVFLYVLFLIWRVTSLVFYSIYSTECFFRAKLATLRCENFTMFPSPTTFEIAWQISSFVNCVIAMAVLHNLPDFPGFRVILARLVRIARFWSLLCQLLVVIVYNTILFFHEHLVESALIELGFILDEVAITVVVCFWNFVPAPTKVDVPGFLPSYFASIVVFFLENFYLFLLMSSQAAMDVTGIHEFESRAKGLQALGIVLNATEATFYFAVMKFFWNKIFEHDKNLLLKETF